MGRNVVDYIIPLVNHLRKMMPLEFGSIFPSALLEQHQLSSTIQCHDLKSSDDFFDAIQKKYVLIFLTVRFLLLMFI